MEERGGYNKPMRMLVLTHWNCPWFVNSSDSIIENFAYFFAVLIFIHFRSQRTAPSCAFLRFFYSYPNLDGVCLWASSHQISWPAGCPGKRAGNFAIWTLQPTLVARAGFFVASDEELRRTQVVYTSGEALTETGNRAWKASGTQGNFSPVTGM